jgi:uncharacterized protein
MTRGEALALLESHVRADNLKRHCLATEAIMRELARRLGHDENLWGIAGLLHDLDFDETHDNPGMHGRRTIEILSAYPLPQEIFDAILRHNAESLDLERESILDYALTCAETVTGLIAAAALVHPDKSVRGLAPKSVLKRMKSKDFARNVNRGHVVLCEKFGIPLVDFIELSLKAMTSISDQLGL